jgi:threonine/homoserine efflux transporter RhtA
MISRTPACLSGILGGACLVARYVLDDAGTVAADGQVGTALRWAGLTWLALAFFAAGVGLTARSMLALRLVVGVCVALLGYTALSLLYPATGELLGDAVFGGVTILASLVVWWRGRGRRGRPHGSHVSDA